MIKKFSWLFIAAVFVALVAWHTNTTTQCEKIEIVNSNHKVMITIGCENDHIKYFQQRK